MKSITFTKQDIDILLQVMDARIKQTGLQLLTLHHDLLSLLRIPPESDTHTVQATAEIEKALLKLLDDGVKIFGLESAQVLLSLELKIRNGQDLEEKDAEIE